MRKATRPLLGVMAAGAMVMTLAATTPAHAEEARLDIVDHGQIPLTATTIAGAASAVMPNGEPRLWGVVGGRADFGVSTYLAEIDPITKEVINSYDMPDITGSWGVEVAEDGTVWVAGYMDAAVYYLPYGADEIERAGVPDTGFASFLWQIDTDDDGVAFTGTYEGWGVTPAEKEAHLVSYDRTTGEFRDYGTFGEYQYVRSTAVIGDTVYAGLGTPAALYAVDIESGEKTEITLPAGRETGCSFAYELDSDDTDLYLRMECDRQNYGYVYDTVEGEWTDELGVGYVNQRIGTDEDGNVYYQLDGRLTQRATDGSTSDLGAWTASKGIGVVTDDAGDEYVVGIYQNVLLVHDLDAGTTERTDLLLPGTMVAPRSSALGPDGDVHVGGYFSGGLATLDIETNEWTVDMSLGQTEEFVAVGDYLYSGNYPGANIRRMDPSRPLAGNLELVFSLTDQGQDRPFAMVDADGVLGVGTVPDYGSLTSVLALYDTDTGDLEVYEDLIEDQSIVALAHSDGVIYGGTSTYGGNGIAPTQDAGRVFAFDMETETLLWNVELPGQLLVTAVAFGADGKVYAGTHGNVYALDAEDGGVVFEHVVRPYDWNNYVGGTWTSASLNASENGHVYGSIGGHIIRISTGDEPSVETLAGASGNHTVLSGTDHLFWIDGQHLRSVVWATDAPDPDPDPEPRGPVSSFVAPVTLAGRDANAWGRVDGEASVSTQVKLPSGEWSTSQTREPDEDGFYVIPLTYGKDNAGTLEWRVRVTYADGTVEFGESMTQQRVARTTLGVAASTVVGRDANAWGRVDGQATVSTQVRLPNGTWSTSQVRETEEDGSYVIPLTYGKQSAGSLQWRVHVRHANGLTEVSDSVTQLRVDRPSVSHAGAKLVGENTFVWGSVDAGVPRRVFTQVWVNGAWSTSQVGQTTADGGYTLELTYGKHQGGTYRYRVGAEYPGIGFLFSDEFALVRTIR